MSYNLLDKVEYGGCSAKLPAGELSQVLADLPSTPHPRLLVDIQTHDDAGVYQISDTMALIQTIDFFTPACSDPFEFGQIAAANALSDVYAMGGEVLTAMNIAAFPSHAPLSVLHEILKGGILKVKEAEGVMLGGHTIVDEIPKYGLAVTGTVHPHKVITNFKAKPGNLLLLTKALGTGIMLAGKRIGEVEESAYRHVHENMKQLNKKAVAVMQKHRVKCATDITGFGLAGHAFKMAKASGVTINIITALIPRFRLINDLLKIGCIPGACFRNLEYVESETSFKSTLDYEHKMLAMDAQTSGGLLICCPPDAAPTMIAELIDEGFESTAIIGEVKEHNEKFLVLE